MNLLTEWVKKNGKRIKLNDEKLTVEHAESLGWKRFSGTPEGLVAAKEFLASQVEQAEATVAAAKTEHRDNRTKKSA